jgi:hypothetical protein
VRLFAVSRRKYVTEGKDKAMPLQALTGPECSSRLRLPHFETIGTWRCLGCQHRPPLLPGNIPGTHFCSRLSRTQGHSAAGRIMSMKNSNDTIGNQSRDLPVCSAVPQPLRHRVPHTGLNPFNFILKHFLQICLWDVSYVRSYCSS